MPTITISFSQDHADIIAHLANKTGRTPKEFIEHLVGQHAASQVKGFYQEKFNNLNLSEMKDLFGDILSS